MNPAILSALEPPTCQLVRACLALLVVLPALDHEPAQSAQMRLPHSRADSAWPEDAETVSSKSEKAAMISTLSATTAAVPLVQSKAGTSVPVVHQSAEETPAATESSMPENSATTGMQWLVMAALLSVWSNKATLALLPLLEDLLTAPGNPYLQE